ncbi:MAG: Gfo/Idh/MocA family oxidoreductase [Leeuwenhoekiella sp.]
MKTIRWGIMGLGNIANKFAQDLSLVPGSTLQAVASRSQDKAEAFAKTYRAQNYYGDYESLAQDKNVDVIYIATPHVKHYQNTLLCLNNKKAVLCEKPFAMQAGQVEEMIASAKENQTFLMEALWTKVLPHFQFVEQGLNSGKYGKIQTITADFCFKKKVNPSGRLFNKELGGGSLLDIGIYPIFLALALLGEPEDFSAKAKIGKTGVDETCEMTFSYPEAKAYLKSSIVKKTPSIATIICEHGIIVMNSRFHDTDKITTILNGKKEEHDFEYKGHGYELEAMYVADLLRGGKLESDLMSHDFSRKLIAMLDAVREEIGLKY